MLQYQLFIVITNNKEILGMELMETFINKLNELNFKEMYNNDFLLTWEKTDDEIFS